MIKIHRVKAGPFNQRMRKYIKEVEERLLNKIAHNPVIRKLEIQQRKNECERDNFLINH